MRGNFFSITLCPSYKVKQNIAPKVDATSLSPDALSAVYATTVGSGVKSWVVF